MQIDCLVVNQHLNSSSNSCSIEHVQQDKSLEKSAIEQNYAYIPAQNVTDLLNNDFKDDKEKFLNTILRISEIFKYQSLTLPNNNTREFTYYDATEEHLSFAIQNYKFRASIDIKFLKAGASKIVTRAIMLDTMERMVHHRITDLDCIDSTQQEIELTEMLKDNPFLVNPFQWISVSPNQIDMLQVEYNCDAGELQDASPMIQLLAFRQMAKGVASLHTQGFIHSDLKPGNFFIKGNIQSDECAVKVGDLGAAYEKSKYQNLGAPGFSAPEQFKGRPSYKEKIDSFGLGASMYQILKGNLSYYPGNKRDLMRGFGRLLQDEMDGIILELKEDIKNDPKLSLSERELKLKLADVCASLLMFQPASRFSCHDAAFILDGIS